jgi:O-methyltransferase involved in polyketide biosynthesis
MRSPDPSLVSVTARVVAYYRQFSDVPFARDVAARIGADEAMATLAREHGLDLRDLAFYAPLFEARYKAVGAAIARAGARQVVELASGFSLRGLAMTRDPAFTYVETDLAGVTGEKARLVADLRRQYGLADHGNHHLAVADALDADALAAALAPLRRDEPLAVVNEGLIQYISLDELRRLAANVRGVLAGFAGGVWITPDFAFAESTAGISPQRMQLRAAIAGVTARDLDRSAFADEAALTAFLAGEGFRATVRSQLDEAGELTSMTTLGLSPEIVTHLRPRLRVWTMTPA